jgi:hypothetical protein
MILLKDFILNFCFFFNQYYKKKGQNFMILMLNQCVNDVLTSYHQELKQQF